MTTDLELETTRRISAEQRARDNADTALRWQARFEESQRELEALREQLTAQDGCERRIQVALDDERRSIAKDFHESAATDKTSGLWAMAMDGAAKVVQLRIGQPPPQEHDK